MTLHDRLKVNVLKFYHRYLHNELPPYFYSFNIRTQGDTHSYDAINSGQLHIETTTTEYADKQLRIYLPTLINDVPTELYWQLSQPTVFRISQKTAEQFLIEHTQWYAPFLAAIYVRILSIYHPITRCIKRYISTLTGEHVHLCFHVLILPACMRTHGRCVHIDRHTGRIIVVHCIYHNHVCTGFRFR